MSKYKRVFICDPLAVNDKGHNSQSVRLFASYFESVGLDAHIVCSKEMSSPKNMVPIFNYPYRGYISLIKFKFKNIWFTKFSNFAYLLFVKIVEALLCLFLRKERWTSILKRNYIKLINKFNLDEQDLIILTSADYYSIIALSKLESSVLKKLNIHIRLIGVMENASYARGSVKRRWIRAIKEIKKQANCLTLSSEVYSYSEYLEKILCLEVLTISYPLADKLKISKTKNNVANISMVGCGRKDKGFFEIKKIEYELANANVNYQIIAQDMDEYDLSYSKKYSYGLTDSRQITLLPSHLTDDEIESLYSCADIILLPYDSGVYKYRGSAVYQEGLSYGKLFVCYSGSGMDAWINKYGNGILVQNHTGVAMAIAKLLSLSSEEVANIVNAAKKKYVNDFQLAIKRVI